MQKEVGTKLDQTLFTLQKANQQQNKYVQQNVDMSQKIQGRTAPSLTQMSMSSTGNKMVMQARTQGPNMTMSRSGNAGPLMKKNQFNMMTAAPTAQFIPRVARPPMMAMSSGFNGQIRSTLQATQSSSLHGAAMASRGKKRMTMRDVKMAASSAGLPVASGWGSVKDTNKFSRTSTVLQAAAAAEPEKMIPDMEKRNLMNLILLGSVASSIACLGGPFAYYFYPAMGSGGGGALPALDANGDVVTLTSWKSNHKPGDRQLVQGLKGDAHYLITTDTGVRDYGINAVCTHLGCVVPWNKAENKFMCPCHGSQYNEEGKVVRGPAPLSLAIAHIEIQNDTVQFTPWTETDFRTDLAPWWK